jgi:hypothetical protein
MTQLVRQEWGPHPPTYRPLRGLDAENASALVAVGMLLSRPLRGIFQQWLQPALLPHATTRVYLMEGDVYLHLGEDGPLDILLFPSLPPRGEVLNILEWSLQIVRVSEGEMLRAANGVAKLPTHLSLSGIHPFHLCRPVYISDPQLANGTGRISTQEAVQAQKTASPR